MAKEKQVVDKAALIGIAAAVVIAVAWFVHALDIDINHRFRGDAGSYFRTAMQFKSLGDAISFVGDRAVGFPLWIYAAKSVVTLFSDKADIAQFLKAAAWMMFSFHVLASLFFFWTLRQYGARFAVRVHWLLGCALLVHPGLVSHTTVLLADSLCADLVSAALGLAAWGALQKWRGELVASIGTGAILGFAALCRPAYNPAVVVTLVVYTAWMAWKHRSVLPAAIFAGYLALLVPASVHCAQRFDKLCLFDPSFSSSVLSRSLVNGLDSVRAYWTAYMRPEEVGHDCDGCYSVRDPFLRQSWAQSCTIDPSRAAYGLPGCFLGRPDLGAAFVVKKWLSLFDSYHYQPYAVDLTPRWVRLWSRPFGAASFAGLTVALALVLLAMRKSLPPLIMLSSCLAASLALLHALPHIEPRYGLGLAPGCYLSLAWLQGRLRSLPSRWRTGVLLTVGLMALVFFVQTSSWDALDVVLPRIEARLQ